MRRAVSDLARLFRDDVPPFDTARPDPIEGFRVPRGSRRDPAKPDGN